jgi:hypothetical protein
MPAEVFTTTIEDPAQRTSLSPVAVSCCHRSVSLRGAFTGGRRVALGPERFARR